MGVFIIYTKKLKVTHLLAIFLSILSFQLFFNPDIAEAETISDLIAVWGGTPDSSGNYHRGSVYADLPQEIKKVIPEPKQFSAYNQNTGYPVGQCTWYVWNRSQEFGIDYDQFEGNGGEWGTRGTGSNRTKTITPRIALSTTTFGSSPQYGHVMFVEYIDSKGNALISEGNVIQSYGGVNSQASFMIISKDSLESNVNSGLLNFVEPKNKADIKDYGKNPDGSGVNSGGGEEDKKETTNDTVEQSKFVGEDAWKNKMINFQNQVYKSTFKGIDTGSTGFINSAFISGLNKTSQKVLNFAYIGMMIITIGLFLFMFLATIIYLVVLPNGIGGYKLMDIFEKTTGLDSTVKKETTLELIGRLLLTTLVIACLYANVLPIVISGFINLLLMIKGIFI